MWCFEVFWAFNGTTIVVVVLLAISCYLYYFITGTVCIQHIKVTSYWIMSTVASQIIGVSIVYSTVCSGLDKKKTSKIRVTGLCEGNSQVTGSFPVQRGSNAENVSIWWHHHDKRNLRYRSIVTYVSEATYTHVYENCSFLGFCEVLWYAVFFTIQWSSHWGREKMATFSNAFAWM